MKEPAEKTSCSSAEPLEFAPYSINVGGGRPISRTSLLAALPPVLAGARAAAALLATAALPPVLADAFAAAVLALAALPAVLAEAAAAAVLATVAPSPVWTGHGTCDVGAKHI